MLVVGPNGAGKTNLLEAVHVGVQGFSPRTRAEPRLVRFGEPAARVLLAGTEAGAPVETEVTITPGEGKRLLLNGAPLASAEELRTRLTALAFVPDRLAVVKGGPAVRRAYFDRMLGRLSPSLASLPGEYGRALAQRNEALRRARAGVSSRDAVEPWTEQVAALGSELDASRADLAAALAPAFAAAAETLGLDVATLGYEHRPVTPADYAARFDRDLERGTTGIGPHLRDVEIRADDRDLRGFGSQGEQRTAVLALLLAEAAVLAERRGAPPLLLLDDVLSELDADRRRALLAGLPPGGQTLVSATSADALPAGAPAPALVVTVQARRRREQGGGGMTLEPLGTELRRELGRLGPAGAISDVVAVWPDAVGPGVATNAWPARIARDGTLHVTTGSSTWAFELTHLADTIQARLGELLGDAAPARLRFAPGPLPELGAEAADVPQRPVPIPSQQAHAMAEHIAAGIADDGLREAVARAAAASLAAAEAARDDRSF